VEVRVHDASGTLGASGTIARPDTIVRTDTIARAVRNALLSGSDGIRVPIGDLMSRLERSGFSEFDQLLELVRRTRLVLHAMIGLGELPEGGREFLADATIPHVESIEAGVRGWLRPEMAGLAELRYVLLRTGEGRVEPPQSAAELAAATAEDELESERRRILGRPVARADRRSLTALAHARLVFAFMPGLPVEEVRFPVGRGTYADIPRPRGPAELLERIEELERELWRIATGRRVQRTDGAVRRTYGFFDAAERLDERTFGPAA